MYFLPKFFFVAYSNPRWSFVRNGSINSMQALVQCVDNPLPEPVQNPTDDAYTGHLNNNKLLTNKIYHGAFWLA